MDASPPGGFDFLGYHFERGMKWPRKKSLTKLKEVLRAKTRRTEGRSIKAICEDLNGLLHGWFEYFKHSKSNVFTTIDGYTRGRLRRSASAVEVEAEAGVAIKSVGPMTSSTPKA